MDEQPISTGGDFFSRLENFSASLEPWMVVAGMFFGVIVLWLSVKGRVDWLVLGAFACLNFSGSIWIVVDNHTTLLRWIILGLIAANALRLRRNPGPGCMCYAGYVLLGLAFLPLGDFSPYCLQVGVMLFGNVLVSLSIAEYVEKPENIDRLLTKIIIAAALFAIPAIAFIPNYLGHWTTIRFSGPYTLAPFLTTPGGFYLPFLAWGVTRQWAKSWRIVCGGLTVALLICLLISGQRTGTYAGIIGCLPLLLRRRFGGVAMLGGLLLCGGLLANQVLMSNPDRAGYILERYSSFDITHRDFVWSQGLDLILTNPVIGRGHGASHSAIELHDYSRHGMHNAYLAIWLDSGILGLLLIVYGIGATAWRLFRLILGDLAAVRPESQMARLLLGVLATIAASGMFTGSFSKTTSITTIGLIVVLPLADRVLRLAREPKLNAMQQYYWYVPVSAHRHPRPQHG